MVFAIEIGPASGGASWRPLGNYCRPHLPFGFSLRAEIATTKKYNSQRHEAQDGPKGPPRFSHRPWGLLMIFEASWSILGIPGPFWSLLGPLGASYCGLLKPPGASCGFLEPPGAYRSLLERPEGDPRPRVWPPKQANRSRRPHNLSPLGCENPAPALYEPGHQNKQTARDILAI